MDFNGYWAAFDISPLYVFNATLCAFITEICPGSKHWVVLFFFQKEDLAWPCCVYGQFHSNESVRLQRNGRKQRKVKVSLKIKI